MDISLRTYRKILRLSQAELAQLLDTTQERISNIEKGYAKLTQAQDMRLKEVFQLFTKEAKK